jgi:hypothetical protein
VVKDGGDGGGVGVGRGERVAVLVDELHKQQIGLRVPRRGRRHQHTDEHKSQIIWLLDDVFGPGGLVNIYRIIYVNSAYIYTV